MSSGALLILVPRDLPSFLSPLLDPSLLSVPQPTLYSLPLSPSCRHKPVHTQFPLMPPLLSPIPLFLSLLFSGVLNIWGAKTQVLVGGSEPTRNPHLSPVGFLILVPLAPFSAVFLYLLHLPPEFSLL